MEKIILNLLSEYGLWVVFFGMIFEGTTVIILSGVLCHMGILPCEKTLIVAILGAVVGDQAWYFIGKNYATKILNKFPKINKQIQKWQPLVKSKANLLAIGSRFVYSGAVVFPMLLAINNFSHKKFTILDTLGVTLASIFGLSIGYLLSNSFKKVLGEVGHLEHLLLFIIVVSILIKIYHNKKLN